MTQLMHVDAATIIIHFPLAEGAHWLKGCAFIDATGSEVPWTTVVKNELIGVSSPHLFIITCCHLVYNV